jgi:hypothetical protein
LARNRVNGRLAENAAERIYRNMPGVEFVGSQIHVMTTAGKRIIDHLIRVNGQLVAIEVKSGNAVRSAQQIIKDQAMSTTPVRVAGGLSTILTVVRRFP